MSDRPEKLIILDMLDALTGIETFISGMSDQEYFNDAKTQAAVERYIEIIGEAANQFPESFYNKFSHIKWHTLISLRNRIISRLFWCERFHSFGILLPTTYRVWKTSYMQF